MSCPASQSRPHTSPSFCTTSYGWSMPVYRRYTKTMAATMTVIRAPSAASAAQPAAQGAVSGCAARGQSVVQRQAVAHP